MRRSRVRSGKDQMSKPKTKMMHARDLARLTKSRKPQTKIMQKAALRVLANYQSPVNRFALFISTGRSITHVNAFFRF